MAKKIRRDVLALLNGDVVNGLQGAVGDADAEGKTIEMAVALPGTEGATRIIKKTIAQERVHGYIFQRTPDPAAAPVQCKLSDGYKDLVMVERHGGTATGLSVTTPAGAKLEFTCAQLCKLDYSKGKLAYLSDLKPLRRSAHVQRRGATSF